MLELQILSEAEIMGDFCKTCYNEEGCGQQKACPIYQWVLKDRKGIARLTLQQVIEWLEGFHSRECTTPNFPVYATFVIPEKVWADLKRLAEGE